MYYNSFVHMLTSIIIGIAFFADWFNSLLNTQHQIFFLNKIGQQNKV